MITVTFRMRDGDRVHTASHAISPGWITSSVFTEAQLVAMSLRNVSLSCARAAKLAR